MDHSFMVSCCVSGWERKKVKEEIFLWWKKISNLIVAVRFIKLTKRIEYNYIIDFIIIIIYLLIMYLIIISNNLQHFENTLHNSIHQTSTPTGPDIFNKTSRFTGMFAGVLMGSQDISSCVSGYKTKYLWWVFQPRETQDISSCECGVTNEDQHCHKIQFKTKP